MEPHTAVRGRAGPAASTRDLCRQLRAHISRAGVRRRKASQPKRAELRPVGRQILVQVERAGSRSRYRLLETISPVRPGATHRRGRGRSAGGHTRRHFRMLRATMIGAGCRGPRGTPAGARLRSREPPRRARLGTTQRPRTGTVARRQPVAVLAGARSLRRRCGIARRCPRCGSRTVTGAGQGARPSSLEARGCDRLAGLATPVSCAELPGGQSVVYARVLRIRWRQPMIDNPR
jgi:hypothetical protein